MKRVDFTCSSYKLKFKCPFKTAKREISERKGFLIYLKSEKGITGTGDAAPLPEFGTESYEAAEKAIKNIKLNLNFDLNNIEDSITGSLSNLDEFPALRHGFEQALLNLICKEKNLSLNEILNEASGKQIKVNGVIGMLSAEETVKAADKLIKQGFTTLKLKAGRDNFEEDFECLTAVREFAGDKINLRIDVNGKWDIISAVENISRLEPLNPEYIEQPVNSLNEFTALKKDSSLPLAADESIRTVKDAAEFIQAKAANVLILKPMMLGGIIPVIKIKNAAAEAGIKIVITSSFESVVGRSMAVFAASTIKENLAHGLATDSLFEKDLFPNPYPVKNGIISLSGR